MLHILWRKITATFQVKMQKSDRKEFYDSLYKINLTRGKITAITFLILEILIIIASLIVKKDGILEKPNLYYLIMYIIMIVVMIVFIICFTCQKRTSPKNDIVRNITEVLFCCFLLGWCAGISLLDQITGGEIIVYLMAATAIAVTPIYRPPVIFAEYFIIQTLFLILLPYFNISGDHLFGSYVNSTTIVMICWVISGMRYKNHIEDFLNRKELMRLNKELEQANHKLEILSQTDGLTGVYNRAMFDIVIQKEWNRCKKDQKSIALIMTDIDFFKAFNDNYGHQAGDFCLKQVAETLSECTERALDSVIRYGGEEFAVILPDMEETVAFKLAEKMRKHVEELKVRHNYSTVTDHITISLGVHAVVPTEELTVEEFIKMTDMALYEAKNTKRNKVVVN